MMFVHRGNLLLILLVILGLGLTACRQSAPTEVESPLPLRSPQEAPATSPPETSPPSLQVPTPSPGTAVVRGQLVAVAPSARMFLAGEIYLAPLVYTQGSTPVPFIRIKPGEDPKATLRNEANEFAILDVPPGEYGIVIHTPVNDYVVPDEAGGFLTIQVKEGEVVDLGVIELR